MFNWIKDTWASIKAWFKNSETILLARVETVVGFITMALSALDWSPLVTLGMDATMSVKQGLTLGGIMFFKGLVTEWARRRNTIELDSRLIPTSIVKDVTVTTTLPTTVTTEVSP